MKTLILLILLFLGGKISAQDTLNFYDFPDKINLQLIYSADNSECSIDSLSKDVLFLLLEQQKLNQQIIILDSIKSALKKKRQSLEIYSLFKF